MVDRFESVSDIPKELLKPVEWARIFWVLVPTGEMYDHARRLQERIEEQFQIYRGKLPPLHITVEHLVATDNAPAVAAEALRPVCQTTRPFWIRSAGWVHFDSHRAIGLRILPGRDLLRFSARSREALMRHGIDGLARPADWAFHLTLASNTFARRQWSEAEYRAAIEMLEGERTEFESLVEGAELWHPIYEPRLRVIARLPFSGAPEARESGRWKKADR